VWDGIIAIVDGVRIFDLQASRSNNWPSWLTNSLENSTIFQKCSIKASSTNC
jgi:hypothetical protein